MGFRCETGLVNQRPLCFGAVFRLRASYFLLLRQKKVSKEKATPLTRLATPTPLRYSPGRAAAELGATPLKQSSPTTPGLSALLTAPDGGPGKASRFWRSAADLVFGPFLRLTAKTGRFCSSPFKGGADGNSQSIALRRSARACCAKHALEAGWGMGFRCRGMSFVRKNSFEQPACCGEVDCSTETHPHPNRRVGFAQPTRFGGAERCSAKHRLNPLEGEGTKSQNPKAFPPRNRLSTPGRLSWPLGRCRATEKLADKGRGLFEARRAEFRSPRQFRVAQGTGRSPAPYGGVLFLCLLSFCTSKKKVGRAAGAKPTPKPSNTTST